MTDATFALYDGVLVRASFAGVAALRALNPARVRDALGYRAWIPPRLEQPVAPAVPAAPLGLRGRVRNAALALRYTLPGRVLYRLTPPRMRERLRRRLR